MQAALVYKRTAKGTLELRNPASAVSGDMRALLGQCDGRTDLAAAGPQLGPHWREWLQRLESGGYATACGTEDGDLDFTSPAALSKLQAEAESRARAEAEARIIAEEAARQAAEARRREEAQTREQAAAAERAARAARAREQAEAAARTADAERQYAAQQAGAAGSEQSKASAQARMEAAMLAGAQAAAAARTLASADAQAREALAQAQAIASRARQEAQARARAESEAQARAHAEAHARAMIEAQLKAMSAALARAQALAREEAEARARLTADLQARDAAEANARAEAAAAARSEAEREMRTELARLSEEARQAREIAEARALTEREARTAAESLAEEERRARAVAESTAAEERARREADVRRAAEEAQAQARAESEAQLDAQRRAHAAARAAAQARMEEERQAREAAEARARLEAETRIAQESTMQVRAEQVVRQRLAEELVARDQAEREADARYRAEAAERAQRAAVAKPAATKHSPLHRRKPIDKVFAAKVGGSAVVALLVAGALLAPLVPLDRQAARFEKDAAALLGQPVRIGQLKYELLPTPRLVVDHVVFGPAYASNIERITVAAWPWDLGGTATRLDTVKAAGIVTDNDGSLALASLLRPRPHAGAILSRLEIEGARVVVQDLPLVVTSATLNYKADGTIGSAMLRSGGATLRAAPSIGGSWSVDLDARQWRPPLGPAIDFEALTLRGTIEGSRLTDGKLEGRLAGGEVRGMVQADWRTGVRAAGTFELDRIDLQRALAACTSHFTAQGTLSAHGRYSLQATTLGTLVQTPHVNADFRLASGELHNVDVVRALQQVTAKGVQGGRTRYEQIEGNVEVVGDRYRYRQLKLTSGPMTAAGDIELAPGNRLAGRIAAEVSMTTRTAIRGVLTVGGSLMNPVLRP